MKIICEVSSRHYHPAVDKGYTKKKDLSQTGQWAANERAEYQGLHFGVIMPPRPYEKYELSITDWWNAKLGEPVFEDGKSTTVVQLRHFHCSPVTATELGLKQGDTVSIYKDGPRAGRLDKVYVKIDPSFQDRIHLDTDEANALYIKNGDEVELIHGYTDSTDNIRLR
jgi:putative phosphotransacetylase